MKKDMTRKPFFARLLEEQELELVSGGTDNTLQYPSDGSATLQESNSEGTLKYPSDTDERDL
ncbi:MAG TPA: microviridin/marinostatin family tricyclic proteinase inhibitor [Archangium sp.]|uniref:microviridin/marinostatin family tricyclic proteinase inhibitor n=1 Tax=Archangium sp. TaxID=1872627 RepID=UPI002E36809C|nr:microviridin/marinostatin family tricyclic proteinase inhibitor [Archangium sp.]HEX5749181.1 microviridin/marinostatin family tricyclic proteinase inhibitor [Archangium sp.]